MLSKIILPKRVNKPHYFPKIGNKQTLRVTAGINAVIGPNACGKTTILNAIRRVNDKYDDLTSKKLKSFIYAPAGYEYSISLEFDDILLKRSNIITYNPGVYSADADSQNIMSTRGVSAFISLHVFRMSNAQCSAHYFSEFFNRYKETIKNENCIILSDELETSNDLTTIDCLMNVFKSWTKHCPNLQILIATHHPAIIKYADNVIELMPNYKSKLINDWKQLVDSMQ